MLSNSPHGQQFATGLRLFCYTAERSMVWTRILKTPQVKQSVQKHTSASGDTLISMHLKFPLMLEETFQVNAGLALWNYLQGSL